MEKHEMFKWILEELKVDFKPEYVSEGSTVTLKGLSAIYSGILLLKDINAPEPYKIALKDHDTLEEYDNVEFTINGIKCINYDNGKEINSVFYFKEDIENIYFPKVKMDNYEGILR